MRTYRKPRVDYKFVKELKIAEFKNLPKNTLTPTSIFDAKFYSRHRL
jgi:hypothetical protein